MTHSPFVTPVSKSQYVLKEKPSALETRIFENKKRGWIKNVLAEAALLAEQGEVAVVEQLPAPDANERINAARTTQVEGLVGFGAFVLKDTLHAKFENKNSDWDEEDAYKPTTSSAGGNSNSIVGQVGVQLSNTFERNAASIQNVLLQNNGNSGKNEAENTTSAPVGTAADTLLPAKRLPAEKIVADVGSTSPVSYTVPVLSPAASIPGHTTMVDVGLTSPAGSTVPVSSPAASIPGHTTMVDVGLTMHASSPTVPLLGQTTVGDEGSTSTLAVDTAAGELSSATLPNTEADSIAEFLAILSSPLHKEAAAIVVPTPLADSMPASALPAETAGSAIHLPQPDGTAAGVLSSHVSKPAEKAAPVVTPLPADSTTALQSIPSSPPHEETTVPGVAPAVGHTASDLSSPSSTHNSDMIQKLGLELAKLEENADIPGGTPPT